MWKEEQREILYGPRLTPRAWHTCLKLEPVGFMASDADPGLYIAQYKEGNIYILVYVDGHPVSSQLHGSCSKHLGAANFKL